LSHPEQLGFFQAVVASNGQVLMGGRVIEVGSLDVNGSIRKIFAQSEEYVGVDLAEGPSVDLVSYGHEVDYADAYFDTALSGECFEHDPHWRDTFLNMCRMTRPGGLVAFTCASSGRPEHGTRRTDRGESPGTQAQGIDYYHNLTAPEFRAQIPLSELFSDFRFWYLPTSFDLYFAGVRAGDPAPAHAGASTRLGVAHLPDADAVADLRLIMSWPHRVARLPLRAMVRALPENRFQSWALPYWRTLLRMQDRLAAGRFRRAEHC